MSKPDRPGELREVTVNAISLVSKAANGEKFKIFKSAAPEEKKAPEAVKKDERGLFRILKEFFTGNAVDPEEEKAVEPEVPIVEKSGRKISGDRLDKLKNMQAILNDVLSGLEDNKEDNDLTSEEITKAVQDAIKPLDERIAQLEKGNKGDTLPDETKQPQQPDIDVAEVVKNAVNEAVASLSARLEKVEKARGVSNRVPEENTIEKSANDFWGGIF